MSKKLATVLASIALMFSSSTIFALGFSAGVIFVDDRLYQDLAANYQQSLEELAEDNKDFAKIKGDLEKENAEFQKKLAELQANRLTLGDSDIEKRTSELEALQEKIVALEQSAGNIPELQALQQSYQQSIQVLNQQLINVVREVAEDRGLDVVFPANSVVYVSDDVEDITNDVINKLTAN